MTTQQKEIVISKLDDLPDSVFPELMDFLSKIKLTVLPEGFSRTAGRLAGRIKMLPGFDDYLDDDGNEIK